MGSFSWGSPNTKNKAGECHEGAGDLVNRTSDDPLVRASASPGQNLTPTSSVGVWPGSRPMDIQNAHVDIDLMRD